MRRNTVAKVSIGLALALLSAFLGTGIHGFNVAHATTNPTARLEVWSPVVHSSNITDPGLTAGPPVFPVGSQFNVRVNLTYTGHISLFDITLHYNLTIGPNVLQAVFTGDELLGALIDPSQNYGNGCTANGGAHVDGSKHGKIRVPGQCVCM